MLTVTMVFILFGVWGLSDCCSEAGFCHGGIIIGGNTGGTKGDMVGGVVGGKADGMVGGTVGGQGGMAAGAAGGCHCCCSRGFCAQEGDADRVAGGGQ